MKKLKESTSSLIEKFLNCSASIALNSQEVMITGGSSPPVNGVWIFNLQTEEFKKDSRLLTAWNAHSIVKCEGLIYVIGGFSGKERLNTVEWYNEETKTWKNLSNMRHKRHYLACCSLKGQDEEFIYVFGGFYGGSD